MVIAAQTILHMKLLISMLFVLMLSSASFAQKVASSLKLKHARALKRFLTIQKQYQFMSEKKIDKDYLKQMRESFGKPIAPYYRAGDFNRDGIEDFAMIL